MKDNIHASHLSIIKSSLRAKGISPDHNLFPFLPKYALSTTNLILLLELTIERTRMGHNKEECALPWVPNPGNSVFCCNCPSPKSKNL